MTFNAEGGDFELSLNYQTYSQEDQVLITGTDTDGATFTLHDTTCCGCQGAELLHVPAGTNTWRYHACVILGIPRDISPRIATICLGLTETPPYINMSSGTQSLLMRVNPNCNGERASSSHRQAHGPPLLSEY